MSPTALASEDSASLCRVLKEVLPRVDGYRPEGARAELVMALAEQFDYDGDRLNAVKAEIDDVTTSDCPGERERLLAVVKTSQLRDAL